MVPFELVPQAPAHLLDWPGWSWVGAARAAPERPPELPLDAIFSTFPAGEEPDTWPSLTRRLTERPFDWHELAAGASFALLLAAFYLLYLATRSR